VTSDSARRRVLVADNNSDLAEVLGELIRMEGSFEFAGHVSTGTDALSRVRSEVIDVLILDLGLEDVHGFDVLERLVKTGSRTKVIVHSGHSSPELAAHAKRKGAAAYIVKDGDLSALMAAIHAA
jgi:DNA-binding NarL/FixJ family response regulator